MIREETIEALREDVKTASLEEIKKVRLLLYKATRRRKGKYFTGYLHGEYYEYAPIVIDYLYENGLIKKRSLYALVSFAAENLIATVVKTIKQGKTYLKTPTNTEEKS